MNNEKKAPVLTLEHLAPYIPYGIRIKVGKTERNLTAVSLDSPFVFVSAWKGSREKEMVEIGTIKPILRPLSDLTKEIEHNGERFVPKDILVDRYYLKFDEYDRFYLDYYLIGETDSPWTGFHIIQLLIQWHFDVFGLIEKGLAIDINSIEGKETNS